MNSETPISKQNSEQEPKNRDVDTQKPNRGEGWRNKWAQKWRNMYESFIFGNDLPNMIKIAPKARPDLYIWGWIAYKDIFPEAKIHITEVCLHLASTALNQQSHILRWNWDHCETHNCTD